jgi:hypothetical protein
MRSFVGRSSVTKTYISSCETGLTPTFTFCPNHIVAQAISAGRGTTARHTP